MSKSLFLFFILSILTSRINYGQSSYQDNVISLNIGINARSYNVETLRGDELGFGMGLSPGITFLRRIGYSTSVQGGLEFNFQINDDDFKSRIQGFQIPLRFRKIFVLDKLKNLNKGSKARNLEGLGLVLGGYYGLANSVKTPNVDFLEGGERIKSDEGYFGAIGAIGYIFNSEYLFSLNIIKSGFMINKVIILGILFLSIKSFSQEKKYMRLIVFEEKGSGNDLAYKIWTGTNTDWNSFGEKMMKKEAEERFENAKINEFTPDDKCVMVYSILERGKKVYRRASGSQDYINKRKKDMTKFEKTFSDHESTCL